MSIARSMTKFTVKSNDNFPMDMLRHDMCWPADTTSAMEISNIIETHGVRDRTRTVHLFTWATSITPERWKSFGWTVTLQERV